MLSSHKTEWLGVGCWLIGLECAIDAWLASSFGLRLCQLGRLEIAVAIFQKRKNQSKERLFLHFNYQDKWQSPLWEIVWLKTEREAVLKGEPMAYLQEALVKTNIFFGHSFQSSSQKKNELQISDWEAQCTDLLDATTNGTLQIFLFNIQLYDGYLEVKQFFFGCQPIQDH